MKKNRCSFGKNIGALTSKVIVSRNGNAITKRRPDANNGGTLSTAIFIPIQVVPHVKQTIMYSIVVNKVLFHILLKI